MGRLVFRICEITLMTGLLLMNLHLSRKQKRDTGSVLKLTKAAIIFCGLSIALNTLLFFTELTIYISGAN